MWTKKDMHDQTGKTIMVTGANTGIGFETALALYEKGAHVVLACRSQENAQQALEKIKAQQGTGSLEIALLDLGSLTAIRQFANDFKQKHQQLHTLINNAGVMIPPPSKTTDGYELQFGVNHVGHFALTAHLYPLLKSTPGARIVTVSSNAYLRGSIDFNNLHSEISYDAMREYCQSKLANVMFSLELQRRIEAQEDKVLSIAVQPGANKTDLTRHMSTDDYAEAVNRVGELMEPWQGALPSLYAATVPTVAGGDFYSPDQDGGYRGYPAKVAIAPHALDEALAKQLWQWSEKETGLYFHG